MTTAFFLLVGVPVGIAVASWAIGVAMRLRHPQGPVVIARIECPFCGAGAFRGTLRRLAGGACDRCGAKPTRWVIRAQLGGAGIPVLALYVAADPMTAAAITLAGWLLLAIWIADELSLWVPHAFWASGLVGSFVAQASIGGASDAAVRAGQAAVLVGVLALGAAAVRHESRIAPVGLGDYGVVAFIGVALGYDATLDVLLLAGVLALAFAVVRASGSAAQGGASVLATAAVVLVTLFGVGGACVSAPLLVRALCRGRARARTTPLPLGAFLAAATFIVVTWTAPR